MTEKKPIFRNSGGVWLSKQLFFETTEDKSRVLYSLKPEDHKVGKTIYPSLRRLYMELGDETEFVFSETYFGGWPHWKRLLQSQWFLDHILELREELAARNAAIHLLELKKAAKEGSVSSSRYLLEQGWLPKESKAGRPTKEKIRQEAEKIAMDSYDITEDLDRISSEIGSFK